MIQFFQTKLTSPYITGATSEDIPQLSTIHSQSFTRGWSKNELGKLIGSQGALCLVLRQEGKIDQPPMGFVLCRQASDEAEIITIATEPKNRKRGIGRFLMDAAIRNLQSDRVKSLFLEVDETNANAIGLYRSLGFVQAGERKGYYSGHSDDEQHPTNALVMRLDFE